MPGIVKNNYILIGRKLVNIGTVLYNIARDLMLQIKPAQEYLTGKKLKALKGPKGIRMNGPLRALSIMIHRSLILDFIVTDQDFDTHPDPPEISIIDGFYSFDQVEFILEDRPEQYFIEYFFIF